MTAIRVDFYILNSPKPESRYPVACRLAEKAYGKGHQLYVMCQTPQQVTQMDQLLWTYQDTSFLPHSPIPHTLVPRPPIELGTSQPPDHADLVINFSDNPLEEKAIACSRIIEIVPQDPQLKTQLRQHYRTYQACGFEIHSHHLN